MPRLSALEVGEEQAPAIGGLFRAYEQDSGFPQALSPISNSKRLVLA